MSVHSSEHTSTYNAWWRGIFYRVGQALQHLGLASPLTQADWQEVRRWLPTQALPLFQTMTVADQQHCLRVCRGLQARGYDEPDLLAAALLHDVGKGAGRVPFWVRPTIVLGKMFAPRLLTRLVVPPRQFTPRLSRWRRSLSYSWFHAELGADLAAAAGLSSQATLYIRTHHQARGPAAALHSVDEVS